MIICLGTVLSFTTSKVIKVASVFPHVIQQQIEILVVVVVILTNIRCRRGNIFFQFPNNIVSGLSHPIISISMYKRSFSALPSSIQFGSGFLPFCLELLWRHHCHFQLACFLALQMDEQNHRLLVQKIKAISIRPHKQWMS